MLFCGKVLTFNGRGEPSPVFYIIHMNEALNKNLTETFESIKNSSFNGVKGALLLQGKKNSPMVGVTICTHGNELCGLSAAKYLIDEYSYGNLNTTVLIVINNLVAAEKQVYGLQNDSSKNRFVDLNMNRLPSDLHERTSINYYEVERAIELLPIWNKFDLSLDFHSTTQDCEGMLIDINNNFPLYLSADFGITKLIKNIANIQVGKPASAYYGSSADSITCSIECGQHHKKETFEMAGNIIKEFIKNLEGAKQDNVAYSYEEYYICDSVIFPDTTYELVETFENFAKISKGTLLAKGNGPYIHSNIDGHALFAGRRKFDTTEEIREEALFISEPVRIVKG